jgi:hypothetical protein
MPVNTRKRTYDDTPEPAANPTNLMDISKEIEPEDDAPIYWKKQKTVDDDEKTVLTADATQSTADMTPFSSQYSQDNMQMLEDDEIPYSQDTQQTIDDKPDEEIEKGEPVMEEEMQVDEEPVQEEETGDFSNAIFTANELYESTSNPSTVKNSQFLKLLGGFDSIHDFMCITEGKENDKKKPRVNVEHCGKTLTALTNNLNSLNGTNASNVKEWLKNSTQNRVSPSGVEEQGMEYFENIFSYELANEKKYLTYREIIDYIENHPEVENNQRISNAVNDLIGTANTVVLSLDEKDYESYKRMNNSSDLENNKKDKASVVWDKIYKKEDKQNIGLFILNFYFSTRESIKINSESKTFITFDAMSSMPSSIFGLMNEVINLVTPLNIADSATTGESHLIAKEGGKKGKRNGVKNYYHFPYHDTDGVKKMYYYSSNIYTYPLKLSITLPNNDFAEGKQYDFSIVVKKPNSDTFSIDFNKQQKSGPSVSYLSSLIATRKGVPESTMVDLSKIINNLSDSLLLDLKRSGDWEQCNAAKTANYNDGLQQNRTILCTLDRLCALYSRCIGQNTMYHQSTNLTLFRFEGKSATIEQRFNFAKQKYEYLNNNQANIESYDSKIQGLKNLLKEKKEKIYNAFGNKMLRYFSQELLNKTIDALEKLRDGFEAINDEELKKLIDITSNGKITKDNINRIFVELSKLPDNLKKYLSRLSEVIGSSVREDNLNKVIDKIVYKLDNNDFETTIGYYNYGLLKEIADNILFINKDEISSRNMERENYSEKYQYLSFIDKMGYIKDKLYGTLVDDCQNDRICTSLSKISNISYPNIMEIWRDVGFEERRNKMEEILTKITEYNANKKNRQNYSITWNNKSDDISKLARMSGEEIEKNFELNMMYPEIDDKYNTIFVLPPSNRPGLNNAQALQRIGLTYHWRLNAVVNYEYLNILKENITILENITGNSSDNVTNIGGAVGASVVLSTEGERNLVENSRISMTNEFIILCQSLTEICEIFYNSKTNFDNFITRLKSESLTLDIKIQIEKSIFAFINNCSEIFQDNLYSISESNLEFIKLRDTFSTICLFFAFVYFDYQNETKINSTMIELFNSKDNNAFLSMYVTIWPDFGFDQNTTDIINTIIMVVQRTKQSSPILTPTASVIFEMLWFTVKLRQNIEPENIILILFVFFQNYFKYVLIEKTPENGYYPGLINDFNNNTEINKLFQKLQLAMTITTSSEYLSNVQIFDYSDKIIYHLLAYILNPGTAVQLATLSASLAPSPFVTPTTSPLPRGGGKRHTHKNRDGKPNRKTKRPIKRRPATTRKARKPLKTK